MRDDDLKIIDGFLNVCKVVHPEYGEEEEDEE